jgi:hypothetical protein
MQRRRFLAVCGAGLLAGCLGESSADTPDRASDTPDDGSPGSSGSDTPGSDGGTDTGGDSGDGTGLSVSVEKLQPALVAMSTPDSIGVYSADRTQYLFLQLAVERGEAPARSELSFRFDGDEHDLLEADGPRDLWRLYDEEESRYDGDRGEGWVCFPLPATGAPEGAGLTWGDNVWVPSPEVRERLGAESPPLSVEWSAPDTVEMGEPPAVEVSVTNEGDRAGRFVGALNRSGPRVAYTPVTATSRPIPAGETETWTLETDALDGQGGWTPDGAQTAATYYLHWPGDRGQRTVEVVPRE